MGQPPFIMITLGIITLPDSLKIADWRNDYLKEGSLRSIAETIKENQNEWLKNIQTDDSCHYFSIYNKKELVGYCGLDKIDKANNHAEVSLLIGREHSLKSYGRKAIGELLRVAFDNLKLNLVWGEVYNTTNNLKFWMKSGFIVDGRARMRKKWEGVYYSSTFISINSQEYRRKYE